MATISEIDEAIAVFIRNLEGIYTPEELADMADKQEAADADWQHRHDWRIWDSER